MTDLTFCVRALYAVGYGIIHTYNYDSYIYILYIYIYLFLFDCVRFIICIDSISLPFVVHAILCCLSLLSYNCFITLNNNNLNQDILLTEAHGIVISRNHFHPPINVSFQCQNYIFPISNFQYFFPKLKNCINVTECILQRFCRKLDKKNSAKLLLNKCKQKKKDTLHRKLFIQNGTKLSVKF